MSWWFSKKKGGDDEKIRLQAQQNVNAKEIAELEAKIKEYELEKSAAYSARVRVKDELVELEKALVAKKSKYDHATGVNKKLLANEYKLIDKRLRQKQGEPALIDQRIEQYDTLIASARQAIQMLRGFAVGDDARKIGEKHEEGLATLREDTAAVNALANGLVGATEDDDFDIEASFAELMGEGAVKSSEAEPQRSDEPERTRRESLSETASPGRLDEELEI